MFIKPDKLKELRQANGHTTWSLASESDVSQSRIWELEQEPAQAVRPTTARRLAQALGVRIKDITVASAAAVTGGQD